MKTNPEKEMTLKTPQDTLDEDQKIHISQIFERKVVPRLKIRNARTGALCCNFAGKEYCNWLLFFRSRGSGFEITGFEYDEDASELNL